MATFNLFSDIGAALRQSTGFRSVFGGTDASQTGFEAMLPQGMMYGNVAVPLPANEQELFSKGPGGNHIIWTVQDWRARRMMQPPPLVYEVKDEKAYGKLIRLKALDQFDNIELRTKALEEVQLDPTIGLGKRLTKPNPDMHWKDLIYNLSFLYDNGNSLAWGIPVPTTGASKVKKFQEIWPLSPYRWQGIKTSKLSDGYESYQDNNGNSIPADEVLHLRRWGFDFDSNNTGLWGRSPLASAKQLLTKNNAAQSTGALMMTVGGRKFIISPKGVTPAEDAPVDFGESTARARRTLKQTESGGMAFFNTEMTGLPVGFTAEELGLDSSNQSFKQEVCAIYHVQTLSVFNSAEGSTYANLLEANKASIRDGILPDLMLMYEKLSEWLTPGYAKENQRLVIMPDTSVYDELQKDVDALIKKAHGMYLSPNQVNAMIDGWGESDAPGMNVVMAPANAVPLSEIISADAANDPKNDGSYQ